MMIGIFIMISGCGTPEFLPYTEPTNITSATKPLPTKEQNVPETKISPTEWKQPINITWPELLFLGAGGGPICGDYKGWPLPYIDIDSAWVYYGIADMPHGSPRELDLMIWVEDPIYENIELTFHSQVDDHTMTKTLYGVIDENNDGPDCLFFSLWWPMLVPSGEWKVEASSDEFSVDGTIWIDINRGPEVMVFVDDYSIHNEIQRIGSLGNSQIIFPRNCHILENYQQGSPLKIYGSKFPKNTSIGLALYRNDFSLVFEDNWTVQTNSSGIFNTEYNLPEHKNAVSYLLIATWDPDHPFFATGESPDSLVYERKGAVDCFWIDDIP